MAAAPVGGAWAEGAAAAGRAMEQPPGIGDESTLPGPEGGDPASDPMTGLRSAFDHFLDLFPASFTHWTGDEAAAPDEPETGAGGWGAWWAALGPVAPEPDAAATDVFGLQDLAAGEPDDFPLPALFNDSFGAFMEGLGRGAGTAGDVQWRMHYSRPGESAWDDGVHQAPVSAAQELFSVDGNLPPSRVLGVQMRLEW